MTRLRTEMLQTILVELEDRESLLWLPDDIEEAIDKAMETLSASAPQSLKDEVAFDGDTKELDISDIENLMAIEGIYYDESFRNWKEKEDGVIEVELASNPAAAAEAEIYYASPHSLTDEATTLKLQMERVVIDLATAYSLMKKPLYFVRTFLSESLADFSTTLTAITTRIEKAVTDNQSARAAIASKVTEATNCIDECGNTINKAVDLLSMAEADVGENRDSVVELVDAMAPLIDEAANDITMARFLIDENRGKADEAISSIPERVTQAITDIDDAREKINAANFGSPEVDYIRTASAELQSAALKLSESRVLISQGSVSGQYDSSAQHTLSLAMAKLQQAKAYIGMDVFSQERANVAARELQAAALLLSQSRSYLALDGPAQEYGIVGTRELQAANAYISKVNMQMALFKSKIQRVDLSQKFYPIGAQKLALALEAVKDLGIAYARKVHERDNNREWPEA